MGTHRGKRQVVRQNRWKEKSGESEQDRPKKKLIDFINGWLDSISEHVKLLACSMCQQSPLMALWRQLTSEQIEESAQECKMPREESRGEQVENVDVERKQREQIRRD